MASSIFVGMFGVVLDVAIFTDCPLHIMSAKTGPHFPQRMNVGILAGARSKCKPKTRVHNLTCAEYSSVAGFDDIRGIKFLFENLQIG